MRKYNLRYKILFNIAPPNPWVDCICLKYVSLLYHNDSTSYQNQECNFVYTGHNYSDLLEYLKMR